MPVVPFARPGQRQQVDPIFMAIAAADLHEAGMLFEPPKAAYVEPPVERSEVADASTES